MITNDQKVKNETKCKKKIACDCCALNVSNLNDQQHSFKHQHQHQPIAEIKNANTHRHRQIAEKSACVVFSTPPQNFRRTKLCKFFLIRILLPRIFHFSKREREKNMQAHGSRKSDIEMCINSKWQ